MKISLKTSGSPIIVELDTNPVKCRGCGNTMYWGKTEAGKSMPVSKLEDGTYVSHFFDCKKSKDFKKVK